MGLNQRSRRGRQAAASARRCSSADGGAIAFPRRNRPVGPRADDRYGDGVMTRIVLCAVIAPPREQSAASGPALMSGRARRRGVERTPMRV